MTRLLYFFKSDKQLIREIGEGNELALAWLYDNNLRVVMKFVLNNNGNTDDARELLQEALIVLWEKVRTNNFHLQSKLSTYLYAVARNKWLKEIERRKKLRGLVDTHEQKSETPDSLEVLEQEEMAKLISSCMEKLSPACRQLLTMFYYENKSMAEIKSALGFANENVAKSKKYQCKKQLGKMVKKAIKN